MTEIGSFAVRAVLALAFIVATIWVVSRKFGSHRTGRSAGPTVRVLGRQNMSRAAGVAVVAVGHRRLLLGVTDHQVTLLTELGPGEDLDHMPQATPHSSSRTDILPAVTGEGAIRASSPLAGSALDIHSWRATLNVVRERTVRR